MHIGHIGGVEAGDIKARQATTAKKHAVHAIYIGGVETGDIKNGQFATPSKHNSHVGHIGGVESFTEIYGGQLRTVIEHLSTVGIGINETCPGDDSPHPVF